MENYTMTLSHLTPSALGLLKEHHRVNPRFTAEAFIQICRTEDVKLFQSSLVKPENGIDMTYS